MIPRVGAVADEFARGGSVKKKIVIGAVALVVVVVGGALIYSLAEDDAAPRKTVDQVGASKEAGATPASLDGTWRLAADSTVGYRVKESFIGGLTDVEAAGTTKEVTGEMQVSGATIPSASFEAKTAGLTSDKQRRDAQYRRVMGVDEFPTATFALTRPIDLGKVPADGEKITTSATGELTLKGVTKSVTFEVAAKQAGGQINVDAAIPVTFSEFGIDSPSIPGVVTVEDDGVIELVLVFVK